MHLKKTVVFNNNNNNNINNNDNNSVPPSGLESDLLILPKEKEKISLFSFFSGNAPRHAGACFVLSKEVKPAFPVYWYTRPQQ